MHRHAYLILAHGHQRELCNLITRIDDQRNDIYIHLDRKCKDVDLSDIVSAVQHSKVIFIDRISVSWGGFSVIHAEMNLFDAAFRQGDYRYFHLLSGLDLPVKSQDYIHSFFEKHDGENFIKRTVRKDDPRKSMRWQQYHFLQDKMIGKKRNLWKYLDFASCFVQKTIGVQRFSDKEFQTHSQWVSVDNEVVEYLVSRKDKIFKDYRYTYCCDEVFLLSSLIGTGLENTISDIGNLRFIEWKKYTRHDTSPRELILEDFNSLKAPHILFARKFIYPTSESLINILPAEEDS